MNQLVQRVMCWEYVLCVHGDNLGIGKEEKKRTTLDKMDITVPCLWRIISIILLVIDFTLILWTYTSLETFQGLLSSFEEGIRKPYDSCLPTCHQYDGNTWTGTSSLIVSRWMISSINAITSKSTMNSTQEPTNLH